MVIKMYVSGISASKEVKKKQQRALMILQSIKVPFESVDITEPGLEEERDFMKEHCKKVDDVCSPPPHFFNDGEYCGDFDDFDQATEEDRLIAFLKLDPAEYDLNGSTVVPEGLTPRDAGDKGEDIDVKIIRIDDGEDENSAEENEMAEDEEEEESEDEEEAEEESEQEEAHMDEEEVVVDDVKGKEDEDEVEEGDKEE